MCQESSGKKGGKKKAPATKKQKRGEKRRNRYFARREPLGGRAKKACIKEKKKPEKWGNERKHPHSNGELRRGIKKTARRVDWKTNEGARTDQHLTSGGEKGWVQAGFESRGGGGGKEKKNNSSNAHIHGSGQREKKKGYAKVGVTQINSNGGKKRKPQIIPWNEVGGGKKKKRKSTQKGGWDVVKVNREKKKIVHQRTNRDPDTLVSKGRAKGWPKAVGQNQNSDLRPGSSRTGRWWAQERKESCWVGERGEGGRNAVFSRPKGGG